MIYLKKTFTRFAITFVLAFYNLFLKIPDPNGVNKDLVPDPHYYVCGSETLVSSSFNINKILENYQRKISINLGNLFKIV